MDGPRLVLTVFSLQQLVEELDAGIGIGIAGTRDIIELTAHIVGGQTSTLLAENLILLVRTDNRQVVSHLHIVVFTEELIVMIVPDLIDFIEHRWTDGKSAECADHGLTALLRAVVVDHIHQT